MSTGLTRDISVWQKVFEVGAYGPSEVGGCSDVDIDATSFDGGNLGLADARGIGDGSLTHVQRHPAAFQLGAKILRHRQLRARRLSWQTHVAVISKRLSPQRYHITAVFAYPGRQIAKAAEGYPQPRRWILLLIGFKGFRLRKPLLQHGKSTRLLTSGARPLTNGAWRRQIPGATPDLWGAAGLMTDDLGAGQGSVI